MRLSLTIGVACKVKSAILLIEMIKKMTKTITRQAFPCGRPLPRKSESFQDVSLLLNQLTDKLSTFTTEKNLKKSETREKILTAIVRGPRHFTALDLLERLANRFPEVGKATLYRNLPVLVASGIIKEGPTNSEGQVLYELADDHHHDHIVCLDCSQIFEFHDEAIENRQDMVSDQLGFVPRTHRHVIYASCAFKDK
jgi:Fur family transcriptional regulator, ferric uptake regulator